MAVWLRCWCACAILLQVVLAGFEVEETCPSSGCDNAATQHVQHPWTTRGGNLNFSGLAAHAGVFHLSKPSWVFSRPLFSHPHFHDLSFHTSPVIDVDNNIYFGDNVGVVYSLDVQGMPRWTFQAPGGAASWLALEGSKVYASMGDGQVLAIDMKSGKEVWRAKVGRPGCNEGRSLAATRDVLLVPCQLSPPGVIWHTPWGGGSHGVCALSTKDGHSLWNFNTAELGKNFSYNQAPIVSNSRVYLSDVSGGVFCISLHDGKLIWHTPGLYPHSWTTATLTMGPHDILYFNFHPGWPTNKEYKGVLRAYKASDGAVLWKRLFHEPLNAPPAVGPVITGSGKTLAVVVAVGANPNCSPMTKLESLRLWLDLEPEKYKFSPRKSSVYALDPDTGEFIWYYAAPLHGTPVAGISEGEPCCPDMWGQPTIGADGTVYANWAGGKTVALRDANGDTRVDPHDPKEFSSYHHGLGTMASTAISSGLTVTSDCKRVFAYRN